MSGLVNSLAPMRGIFSIASRSSRGFATSARWRAEDRPSGATSNPGEASTSSAPSADSPSSSSASPSRPASSDPFANLPSSAQLLGVPERSRRTPPATQPPPGHITLADPDLLRASLADAFKPNTNIDYASTSGAWWRHRSRGVVSTNGTGPRPPNQYAGRAVDVIYSNVGAAVRTLGARLTRNRIKRELRLGEYYEKPSDKRRRLEMERHRRRFQELVREKVRLVQTIRNRS